MSSSPSSSPKVFFKDFANDHRSRLIEKYPFLTNQQIQAKLRQLWKKVCQENKEKAKNNQSPRKSKLKSSNPDKKSPGSRKRLTWKTDSTRSPSKTVSDEANKSPVSSEVDPGPWYDEIAVESQADSPKKFRENLTEETVTDVFNHELKVEEQENSSEKDSDTVKMEPVLSRLFPSRSLSLGKEELGAPKSSRVLSSQEEEGDSNFNLMFDEEEKIFL